MIKCYKCGIISPGIYCIDCRVLKEVRVRVTRDIQNNIDNGEISTEPCPRCRNKTTRYRIIQTRSADEPPTIYRFCKDCNWKTKS